MWSGALAHLEPNILECEVKWALGSITKNKARRGDVIPTELFKILKDEAVKVLDSICQQIWKTTVATGLEKGQCSFQSLRRVMPKNVKSTIQLRSLHMLEDKAQNPSIEASAICEPRTFRCTSWIQKRQRNQRLNCQHSLDHRESKGIPEKHLLLLHCLC